jgi:sulfur relay protein TusD/DsrE
VVIGVSPWGGSLATAALRFVRSAVGSGHAVSVFFRDDGVYNAMAGDASDGGLDSPQDGWQRLASQPGVELLLCPAAAARRLSASVLAELPAQWRPAGLTRLFEIMAQSDRVVHF